MSWHVSPSQLGQLRHTKADGTVSGCDRRWAGRYRIGLRGTSAQAERGKALHTIQENYLLHGTPPPDTEYGRMWAPAMRYVPSAGSCMPGEVEHDASCTLRGYPVVMYKDVQQVIREDGTAVITDLKSSSDPKRFGMDEAALREDIQAIMYAAHAMDTCSVYKVHLRWVYIRTRGAPQATLVSTTMHAEDIKERWDRIIVPLAERAKHLYTHPRLPRFLEPNPTYCHMYPRKGCDFKPMCPDAASLDAHTRMVLK